MRFYIIFLIMVVITAGNFNLRRNEYVNESDNGILRTQRRLPENEMLEVTDENIYLYLYTINKFNSESKIRINNLDDIQKSSQFNKSKDNLFIIHGYMEDHKSDVNIYVKDAIFKSKRDINVFCVDWSTYAKQRWYPYAAYSVSDVGQAIGDFIEELMLYFSLPSTKFKFVGYDIGAHIAGRIAYTMAEKPYYIVGLDPAALNFGGLSNKDRLDKADAKFVQVIHTNAELYGVSYPSGHADYFPNCGRSQPGCKLNRCSHSRSWMYFAESLERGGFAAKRCQDYEAFKLGDCSKRISHMGHYKIDTRAFGTYYLDTNSSSPFSIN